MMIYGKMKAVVKDIDDPLKMRRIKVVIPQIDPDELSSWAYPCDSVKRDWLPIVDDIVWVEYEGCNTLGDLIWTGLCVAKSDVDDEYLNILGDEAIQNHSFKKEWDYNGNSVTWSPDGFLIKDLSGQTITMKSTLDEEKVEIITKTGITLLLDSKKDENKMNILMPSGSSFLMDDKAGEEKIEFSTPKGHKALFDDKTGSEKIEITSISGHKILIDETAKTIKLKTSDNNNFILCDEQNKEIKLQNSSNSLISLYDGGINILDENGNKIDFLDSGVYIEDVNTNKVEMTTDGIKIEDESNDTLELTSGKVKINGDTEPLVLGDKNADVLSDIVSNLQDICTQASNTVSAIITRCTTDSAVATTLGLVGVATLGASLAPIQTQFATIASQITSINTNIPNTKSLKGELS